MANPKLLVIVLGVILAAAAAAGADEVDDAVRKAREARKAGDRSGAVAILREVKAAHPNDDRPNLELAYLLLVGTEGLDQARDLLVEYLETHPGDDYAVDLLAQVGRRALGEGDPELALSCDRPLIALRPLEKEYRFDWALASYRLGRDGSVRQACSRLIADFPSHYEAYLLKARTLVDEGAYRQVADTYRRLIRERPGDPRVRMWLGSTLLWQLGDFDGAEAAYRAARDVAGPRAATEAEAGIAMVEAERQRRELLRAQYGRLGTMTTLVAILWATLLGGLLVLTRRR